MPKRRRPRTLHEWAQRYPLLYLAVTSVILFLVVMLLSLIGAQLLDWLLTPTGR